MKKHIIYSLASIGILAGLAGCINDDFGGGRQTPDAHSISLTLQSTRAVDAGAITTSENKIATASVFFFPAGSDGTTPATYCKTNVEVGTDNTMVIGMDGTIEDGSSYDIYVVANYDLTTSTVAGNNQMTKAYIDFSRGNPTLNALKALVLTTVFNTAEQPEEAFVMDGQTERAVQIQYGAEVEGSIKLTRVAAKIQLNVSFTPFTETIDGVEYTFTPLVGSSTPAEQQPTVTIHNGIGRATFGEGYVPQPADIINPRSRTLSQETQKEVDGAPKKYYSHDVPLYSYANDWSKNENQTMGTYVELKVEWQRTTGAGDTENKIYYYNVPVSPNSTLVRNNAYVVNLDVSMSGSETQINPIILEGEIEVLSWNEITFDGNMNRYKYLSVDPQRATLNNEGTAQFSYTSSSPIKVEIESVQYDDLSDYETENNTQNLTPSQIQSQGFKAYVAGQEIRFEHKIDKASQFYPLRIRLKVTSTDTEEIDSGLEAAYIDIVQYPSIYITAEKNESNNTRFIYGSTAAEEITITLSNNNKQSLGKTIDIDNVQRGDRNPNQYNVYVTAFDEDDKWDAVYYQNSNKGQTHDYKDYAIGDPRQENINNLGITELQYYRPTKSDDASQYIVAPVFKVASSRGGTSSAIGFSTAKYRCATYQENGYPAGRWRVPTQAEIQYINSLSRNNKIPQLYNPSEAYIAANELAWRWSSPDFGWGKGDDFWYGFVRCIYDVWYWGDEPVENKTTFYWGDNPDGTLRTF